MCPRTRVKRRSFCACPTPRWRLCQSNVRRRRGTPAKSTSRVRSTTSTSRKTSRLPRGTRHARAGDLSEVAVARHKPQLLDASQV
eukprot:3045053-Rhodomonas_salina.1